MHTLKFYPPPPPENRIEEPVVFVGSFTGCWGHEITDHLKHLWFYFDERFQHLKNLPFIWTPLFSTFPSDNFFEMVELMGIPKEKFVCVSQPTFLNQVYVPDSCFVRDIQFKCNRYTREYQNLFQRLPKIENLNNFKNNLNNLNNFKKIYLSRTKMNQIGKDFNEIDLENLFKQQGFSIVYPEKISFKEALFLYQNCHTFAATDGSIGHNVLFCQNVKNVLILRKCKQFTDYQMAANSFVQNFAHIYFIDVGFSPLSDLKKGWWGGPFFLYQSFYLRSYFHLKPKMFPYFKFIKYILFCYRSYFSFSFYFKKLNLFYHFLRGKLKVRARFQKIKKAIQSIFPRST